MKKIMLIVAFTLAFASVNAQSGKYIVSGKIANCADTVVSMTIWNSDGTTSDQMPMKNGKFEMKGETSEPMMVRVEFSNKGIYKYVPDGGYIPYKCSSLWFLVYPGAKAKVVGQLTDFADAYPSGDKENELLAKLTRVIYPLMNECGNIQVKLEADKSLTTEDITKLTESYAQKDRAIVAALNQFVTDYPSSYAAVWFLEDMLLRKQIKAADAERIVAAVSGDQYRNSAWFKRVESRINSVKYDVGNQLPEIKTKNSVDGSEFNSSSLKGKYIIIDFWGSWCGPCMSGMDGLREFRDANKEKVAVLGIAQDNKEAWLRTIKAKNLNWTNLLSGKGEDDFVSKFNITGFPTKILISPDGTILFRESGESEQFYTKIKEFIK